MPEAPLPLWFKLAVSAVFIIVMTVIGIMWRPVSDGLWASLRNAIGLYGALFVIVLFVAATGVLTIISYRRDKRQGRY